MGKTLDQSILYIEGILVFLSKSAGFSLSCSRISTNEWKQLAIDIRDSILGCMLAKSTTYSTNSSHSVMNVHEMTGNTDNGEKNTETNNQNFNQTVIEQQEVTYVEDNKTTTIQQQEIVHVGPNYTTITEQQEIIHVQQNVQQNVQQDDSTIIKNVEMTTVIN